MDANDQIVIRGLELSAHLGVPEAERAAPQILEADVVVELRRGFDALPDNLGATVDYEALAGRIRSLAAARPRRLLETLAADMVSALLQDERVAAAEVEVRKRILPGVNHVAVRMRRAAG